MATTPCTEWNVGALINHNLLVAKFANGVLTGVDAGVNPFSVDDQEVAIVKTPFGEMPGGQFIMVPITDMIVHTWDIAKATGQETNLNPGMCELGFNVMGGVAEGGRKMGAFGAEVSVSESASFQDRMLGLSGRQP